MKEGSLGVSSQTYNTQLKIASKQQWRHSDRYLGCLGQCQFQVDAT